MSAFVPPFTYLANIHPQKNKQHDTDTIWESASHE